MDRVALSEPTDAEERGELCDRCQGNGEIILDWEMYLHEDRDDESVADCPDCSGTGYSDGIERASLAREPGEEDRHGY